MNKVSVKWVSDAALASEQGKFCNIPVVPLSALREVVEGLKVLAIHGQTEKRRALEQLCYKDDDWWSARENYGFAQWLAQRLLAELGEVGE